jgi:Site-specific recombinases, DNA invertase Pin homologs
MLSIEEGVIYTRVSSARQVSEGNGLDSQLRSCQSYAKEKGIKVINAFEDRAISGDKSDRPGLQALLEFLATRNNFTAVIIDDVSRLMRNKEMYYPVKIAIESSGGRLFSVKNDLNDDDPMNSFMEHIMVGVADLERKMNNKRVLDRMKQRL